MERVRYAAPRAVAILWVAALLVLSLPASALAHAELVDSSPADGEELAAPPSELRLVFSEPPQPDGVSVRLFDRHGNERRLAEPHIEGDLGTAVRVAVEEELRSGPYTVVWSVVSAEDEHPVAREFVFGVEEPAAPPSVSAAEIGGGSGGAAHLAARFLSLAGLVLLVGAAVQARWFSLQPRRMAHLAGLGAVLVAAGLIMAAFVGASARQVGDAAPVSIDPPLVIGVGLSAVALIAAMNAARNGRRARGRPWLLVLAAAFGVAWILAATSHAAGVGILLWASLVWDAIDVAIAQPALYPLFPPLFEAARQLNIIVAAVHSLAVAAWIGGLVVAGMGGLSRAEVAEWHPRFSNFALRAFLVVALTGLYQAVLYLSSPAAVVGTDYGVMLLGKHVFVFGVVALAAVNRFLIAPGLRRAGGRLRHRAVGVVRTEAAVGVIVVGAAVLLAGTPPARPPTEVFLAPEVVERLSDNEQTIAGDRPGWELTVSRQSSTRHAFHVHGPDSASDEPILLLQGPDGKPERRLRVRREGRGLAAEGLFLTRDGRWSAELALSQRTVGFSFEVRGGHVVGHHAQASRQWQEAISKTERDVRAARMIDVLTDGRSVMLFAHHDLVAPNRERLEILGGREMISIGKQRFSRQPGGEWQADELGFPFRWPDYTYLERAIGVTVVGDATHAGREVEVLAGFDPESGVGYELWIDRQDRLIRRLVMGVPGHYMINAYYGIDDPLSVEAPV